ncbi:MAG: cytochrome c biogenesis protein CcsA, partial [Cyclobacteriaceae bacterium]|nr:cytochrome c biogenesis protein CcsA [Cyclobacteriaceae bacterium]
MEKGDYQLANELVSGIKKFQSKFGSTVVPSETKVNLEILYNKVNLFKRLYPYFMLVGFVFLIILFTKVLHPKKEMTLMTNIIKWLVIGGFVVHAAGLIARWYISGHEPWSNGYEAMIYIAWVGILAGILFHKKSPITLAVTSILAGIILWVANMSWMDPEITNLVPVLKSYWLTIHVATIVASYGFLALGALLALVNLISMIMRNRDNFIRLDLSIKELTYITEMTLIVGIVLLTIGNFLGGIWANESWGRYWGWDPKETWAMASIIFYAFILHMRFIPGLRGFYSFNLAALVGFSSIIMTYFGVNYYLSGLHSYAKGDPVPVPDFVYYSVAVVALIGILAFLSERKFKKAGPGEDQVE